MPKNASDELPRRRTLDSRSDGEGTSEERIELGSAPRIVKRAVKLRFGGARPAAPAPEDARPEGKLPSARPRANRTQPAAGRDADSEPPRLDIELASRPPLPARPVRKPTQPSPRLTSSLSPGPLAARLRPGIALLSASIVLGTIAQLLDLALGPVRIAWVAAALMIAGIANLFFQLLPRDR